MSNAVSTNIVYKGALGLRKRITKMQFVFPLLSNIFGALVPPESHRLIPLDGMDKISFWFKTS